MATLEVNNVAKKLYLDRISKLINILPLDSARLICAKNASAQSFDDSSEVCRVCFTPLSAGLTRYRLLPCKRRPRQIRRARPKQNSILEKQTSAEKINVASHDQWSSILSVRCLMCSNRTKQLCPLPSAKPAPRHKPAATTEAALTTKQLYQTPLRIKRKKKNSQNAGLIISEEAKNQLMKLTSDKDNTDKCLISESFIEGEVDSPEVTGAFVRAGAINKKNKNLNSNNAANSQKVICKSPRTLNSTSITKAKTLTPAHKNKSQNVSSAAAKAATPLIRINGNNKGLGISAIKANQLKKALKNSGPVQRTSHLSDFLNSLF